ncbi:MAG: TraB/GumN family protein [Myxococcota bacterium]
MTLPWLRRSANGFVLAYAADACVSGLEEALRAATGSIMLLGPRNALAQLVLWAALLVPLAVTLTPRLPTALFLFLSVSALWLNFGAAPLLLLLGSPAALGPTAVGIQLAISAFAFVRIRRRNSGAGWLLRDAALVGRSFSLGHSLAWAAGLLLVGLPAVALYVLLWAASSVQVATQGFVAFDASGVVLADRRYTRADREVRLVGMMHVGEQEGYRALVRSFAGEDTAVLKEGVTDGGDRLETPLSYGRVAAIVGLDDQEDLEAYFEDDQLDEEQGPVFLHADVDVASFAPETIAWLEQIAQVFAADDFRTALRGFGAWSSARRDQWPIVERDLIARRNQHLVARLDEALADYARIVVPWGALHLPAIEAALLERGFVRTAAAQHRLLHWRGIAAKLVEMLDGGGAGN